MKKQQHSLARRRLLQVGGVGVGFAGIVGLNGASFAQLFQSSDIEVPDRVAHLYRPQELLGAPHQLFASVDVSTLQLHLSQLPERHENSIRSLTVAGVSIDDISSVSGISSAYFSHPEGAGSAHITGDFDVDEIEAEIRSLDTVQQSETVGQNTTYRAATDEIAAELAISDSSLILGGTVGTDVDPTRAIRLLSEAKTGDAKRYYLDSSVGRALIDTVVDYPAIGGVESNRLAPLSEVGLEKTVQNEVLENLQGIGMGSRPVDELLSTRTVLKYRSDSPPVSSVASLLEDAQNAYPSIEAGVSIQSVREDGSLVIVETEIDPSQVSLPDEIDEDTLSQFLLQAPALTRDSRVWTEIQRYLSLFQPEEGISA
ncbi:hypothetical protein [Halorientalis salina]|uniref:hypothetical protein n=1 Tax=Halorientalis salina TaxID=2932266 RepID=UPI0010AD484B|nr:hypothetical protein [Halorientalis salina]